MANLPSEVFSSDQVKQIELDYASSNGGHCFELMQRAGESVFEYLVKSRPHTREVWIFCGKGNNGGDGYIVANLLLQRQIPHRVFATGYPHEGTEASVAFSYYVQRGGRVESSLPQYLPNKLEELVIIDALLGTGIESAPQGQIAKWISFINKVKAYTIAVDVPSGIDANTGFVPGNCVRADATVCMLALKPGLFTADAVDYVGLIEFSTLGIDTTDYFTVLNQSSSFYNLPIYQYKFEDFIEKLPKRLNSYNKSDSGKVLIIAGAKGMGGAAIICAKGALRTGAGLVKVATDPVNVTAMLSSQPELMTVDLNDEEGLKQALKWSDVVAVGPGLGRNEKTARILGLLDSQNNKTLVYDADALNILAMLEDSQYNDNRILTPHPGEAARLLGISTEDVNADRLNACYKLQKKYGGIVLLKGAGTIICDGQSLVIINEGSPALATGGSGDLLTGMLVSLLGQGLDNDVATIVAALVHGRAALLAQKNGLIGTLPSDLCPYVRELINVKN